MTIGNEANSIHFRGCGSFSLPPPPTSKTEAYPSKAATASLPPPTDPQQTPNGPPTDPQRTPNRPPMDTQRTPNRSPNGPPALAASYLMFLPTTTTAGNPIGPPYQTILAAHSSGPS